MKDENGIKKLRKEMLMIDQKSIVKFGLIDCES